MSWLGRIFKPSQTLSAKEKSDTLAGLAGQFDAMKDEYLKVIVAGLSDPMLAT